MIHILNRHDRFPNILFCCGDAWTQITKNLFSTIAIHDHTAENISQ